MRDIKVSVIVPIYNAERFLQQCLTSLYEQTLKEIEIIMVNDGSVDESERICDEFVKKDKRFILINQENGGSASARRTGMKKAKGQYIGFIDSDDWAEPNMFERMYLTAAKYDVDIVFCNCYRDYKKKSVKCNKYMRTGYYNRSEIEKDILSRTLSGVDEKGRVSVIRWANYLRIYKRSLIEQYQIYNDPRFRRCQDLQLTFEATLHAENYYYLGDEYLYHNRVVEESQSRGYTKQMWQKIRILIERLYHDVDEYTKQDLHSQMHMCAFFFVVETCLNEEKDCNRDNLPERRKNLETVLKDDICRKFIGKIPKSNLSRVNRTIYNGIESQNVNMIMKAWKLNAKEKKQKRVISLVLSNKYINNLYISLKTLRKKLG